MIGNAPKPFQLLAEHVVLDLVNTLDFRFRLSGPEELLGSYADLLRFLEQARFLSKEQSLELNQSCTPEDQSLVLDAVKDLRETLAAIFYRCIEGEAPFPASLEDLEGYLRDADRHRKLGWGGDLPEWRWSNAEHDVRMPLWLLEEAARELLFSPAMKKIGRCCSADCGWLFVDTSKNHTRRWCNMKGCGNRMKARRHQARRAESSVGPSR
ncbi:MAG: ABATE domain-containing protein [Terracidiphilus sp.]|jgi:predicted RNA-binding Zn ribbon-like protein